MANRFTEREMLDKLSGRYGQKAGNGRRYSIAEHVKNAGGFDANRQADMIAMDLWPSGNGNVLIGHEVKCSRSDWLNELKDPTKADAFKRYMHYWWLVAAEASVYRLDEVPEDWGIMVAGPNGMLRAVRQAPLLTPEPLPYSVLAPLLRATENHGAMTGRAGIVRYVPVSTCLHCEVEIKLHADGIWRHTDRNSSSCKFPPGHGYAVYNGRGYFKAER